MHGEPGLAGIIHGFARWHRHTIVTPPTIFNGTPGARVEPASAATPRRSSHRRRGGVEVGQASEWLPRHGSPTVPYTAETPLGVLVDKCRRARHGGQF